ncbi:MAG: threonine synthase [Alphaproteobacteria bacterium]|nr:threonine synthase [Alphaproteobacteria bacterium]
MKYISTRGEAPILGFEEALLAGLASDGGLYVPESWPRLSEAMIAGFADKSFQEIAVDVLHPFMGDDVPRGRLAEVVNEAYAGFEHDEVTPLTDLGDGQYFLELYHGPTLAFKDVAMQLLARLMDDALVRRGQRATIIGATSGDTGGAAIEAFRGREAVDVFILFPDGRVSDVQRKQMTTPQDANVHTLSVDGTFDDCQALVKGMFNDAPFRSEMALAGVNSINWARVMAQITYYFVAAAKLGAPRQPVAFSVPTGNFGDIFAGYVAAQMGLPVAQLMIATNVNDILARTLASGVYKTDKVIATQSPSMDIQVSSNFERLLFEVTGRDAARVRALMGALAQAGRFDMNDKELQLMHALFGAERIDESETLDIMRRFHEAHGFQIDPHSAVGMGAAEKAVLPDGVPMVTLATAHPAKFPKAVTAAYDAEPDTPQRVLDMLQEEERLTPVANDLAAVENAIREKARLV